jgi:hypothetical protein
MSTHSDQRRQIFRALTVFLHDCNFNSFQFNSFNLI